MKKLYILLVMILLSAATTFGQEWVIGSGGNNQYNCDLIKALHIQFGDETYIRLNDTEYTVAEYHAFTVPDCSAESEATALTSEASEVTIQESFTISVEDVVNLRECAGTNCYRIGVARPSETFEVIGEDGDWYEINYEGASAFIAGWLTVRVVNAPQGLLADFQFASVSPVGDEQLLLYGSTARTGTWWLSLKRADGTNTDIQIEAIAWGADHTDGSFQHPSIFGWGGNDWESLPELLPDSSFYIYLPGDDEIYEFPIIETPIASSYQINWDRASRPASIRPGARIRVLVADSGQANHMRDWAAAVTRSETVAPPSRPQPPLLEASAGQILFDIRPPASGGSPITTYELRYREVGGDTIQIGNVNSGQANSIDGLGGEKTYEVSIAAINRGGKGPYSNWASVTIPKAIASG